MKRILLFFLSIIPVIALNGQQTFNVTNSGFTFNPSEVIVTQGDIVHFSLSASHPVVQVSQATWNANQTTPLSGGFSFPSGTGDYTAGTPETYYYVCTNHGGSGMKGTIVVNASTGFDDLALKNEDKIFPNPAGDYIIYQTNSHLVINEIRIIDIIGKMVIIIQEPYFSAGQVRIDLETLNKGIYFLLVKSEKGTVIKKFLKS